MGDEGSMLAKRAANLRFYEERARQARAAAEAADKPEIASAHLLLAIEYEAEGRDLREQRTGRA